MTEPKQSTFDTGLNAGMLSGIVVGLFAFVFGSVSANNWQDILAGMSMIGLGLFCLCAIASLVRMVWLNFAETSKGTEPIDKLAAASVLKERKSLYTFESEQDKELRSWKRSWIGSLGDVFVGLARFIAGLFH
jgi:hypothetical protein